MSSTPKTDKLTQTWTRSCPPSTGSTSSSCRTDQRRYRPRCWPIRASGVAARPGYLQDKNRVFHKLPTTQECQYYQIHFGCIIWTNNINKPIMSTIFCQLTSNSHLQIMKETANIWEYKVGINAIIANFVCSWKILIKSAIYLMLLTMVLI